MKHIKHTIVLILVLFITSAFSACKKSSAVHVWSLSDSVAAPESVYFDADSGLLFVSNISGEGDKKDGVGWISKIGLDGKPIQNKWVEGLNAPKGMRSTGDLLWVTDIDEVVALDKNTGTVRYRKKIDGSIFLNDIAIGDDGTVYVSDSLTSTIHQIKDGEPSVFMQGDELESPNGLLFKDGKLLVASWGLTTDWSTKVPGRLYVIDPKTKEITYITKNPLGNLDGLEVDKDGNYIVTDWVAGKIFRIDGDGKSVAVYAGPTGLADLAFVPGKNMVVVPKMQENKIAAIRLP